jgi:hypothetical protein
VVVSFKAAPADVASGRYDTALSSWFASIPPSRRICWSFWHEPEDDIERGAFTASQYRAAWDHLISLAPKRDTLRPTIILMQYSLSRPDRPIAQYVTAGLKTLAWDAYLTKRTWTLEATLDKARSMSESFGLGFAIAETSVSADRTAGLDRAAIVTDYVRGLISAVRRYGSEFTCWFETNKSDGDWRMQPYPGAVAAWRGLT